MILKEQQDPFLEHNQGQQTSLDNGGKLWKWLAGSLNSNAKPECGFL